MAAKASFFPYAAAAPAAAQTPLKNEAAALRKTLADKAKRRRGDSSAAPRWTPVARSRSSRGAQRARPSTAPRRAKPSTLRAWRWRSVVETARFAAEARASCASADAAAASRAQERSDAA